MADVAELLLLVKHGKKRDVRAALKELKLIASKGEILSLLASEIAKAPTKTAFNHLAQAALELDRPAGLLLLVDHLYTRNRHVAHCVRVLHRAKHDALVPILLDLMERAGKKKQLIAMRGLVEMNSPLVIGPMCRHANSASSRIKDEAVEMIAGIGGAEAAARRAIFEASYDVRTVVATLHDLDQLAPNLRKYIFFTRFNVDRFLARVTQRASEEERPRLQEIERAWWNRTNLLRASELDPSSELLRPVYGQDYRETAMLLRVVEDDPDAVEDSEDVAVSRPKMSILRRWFSRKRG